MRLPVDDALPRIVAAVAKARAAVVVAPPGTGKTTHVPPALLKRGPLLLLQPRRVAARSIARRIADEQGMTLGEDVGWHVRLERRFTRRTRLLVATEGILTARLVTDPLLSDFATVVIDEFHERSVHADLGLALVRQAARARDDLAIVVMSATLEAAPVAEFLGGCEIVEVEARTYAVDVTYAPGVTPAAAVEAAALRRAGHVLCFLPGAAEIDRLGRELRVPPGTRVLPLHGSLDASAQDEALAPSEAPKVILATNVAETSLTVEGVTDVVDTGLHKVMRYDAERGLDRLELERVPGDSADQRAGRAGRTAPGRAVRLWDARDRLRPRREPEIERVDLLGPVLQVLGWGSDPRRFEWFERPSDDRLRAALDLLQTLGAFDGSRLTPLGETLRRLPLPPRLGRVLVAAGGSRRAALCCAVLVEFRPDRRAGPPASTDSDVLALADARVPSSSPGDTSESGGVGRAKDGSRLSDISVKRLATELEAQVRGLLPDVPRLEDDVSLRRALLTGYPDRVAQRREPGSPRLLLASGTGAVLGRESGVTGGEYLVAHEVAATPTSGREAVVRIATSVEKDWLEPTSRQVVHRLEGRVVRAVEEMRYGRLLLGERAMPVDPEAAASVLLAELEQRGLGPDGEFLVRRARFSGLDLDVPSRLRNLVVGRTRLDDVALDGLLDFEERQRLDRVAPEALVVPSGRRVALDYRDDGTVAASVKLQELFGLGESPRLGPRQEPVLLLLLAPNGRPVQTTRDLGSFWRRTYPEVRKELRGRYPKHSWPEDPWTATPTARAKPRRG
jgi:ATP-dependent helicase HrpB